MIASDYNNLRASSFSSSTFRLSETDVSSFTRYHVHHATAPKSSAGPRTVASRRALNDNGTLRVIGEPRADRAFDRII
jgi:hypothetical protein